MPMQIQTAGAWRRLVEAFDLKGKAQLRLDETVVPVFVVNEEPTEIAADPVDATWTFFVSNTAASPTTALLLNNSVGSRILIDEVMYSTSLTATVVMILTATAAVNPVAGGAADKTWNNNLQTPVVPGLQFGDSGAFVGPDIYNAGCLPSTPITVATKVAIDPGQAFAVQIQTNNLQLRCRMLGRVVAI